MAYEDRRKQGPRKKWRFGDSVGGCVTEPIRHQVSRSQRALRSGGVLHDVFHACDAAAAGPRTAPQLPVGPLRSWAREDSHPPALRGRLVLLAVDRRIWVWRFVSLGARCGLDGESAL